MKNHKKSIRADYLEGTSDLKAFYSYPIQNTDFTEIIRDKAPGDINRDMLYQALSEQYEGIETSSATHQNIQSLLDDQTFTLTTGHQLVLFGGPLYTIYKVLTVIKLAAQLNQELKANHFVPVFWIHTEDHDFEEINHYYTSFSSRHTYDSAFQGRVGQHILTEDIKKLWPKHFSQALNKTYQPGKQMRKAYFEFMNELFGEYGLVILDADHPKLKQQFSAVLIEELTQKTGISTVNETSDKIKAAGYPLQITPREINLFYAEGNIRNRIIEKENGFGVIDTDISFERDELLEIAKQYPERFSPNVCLRPLYQEMILPNLVYTGGWGELSYWLQLKGLFEHHSVNFPLLLPRMSATVFTEDHLNKWEALGFEAKDIRLPLHELNKKYVPQVWENGTFVALSKQLQIAYQEMGTHIDGISKTLVRSVKGQEVKAEKFLKNLEKKIHRVVRHKYPAPFKQIEEIKLFIQADPLVQERIWSLAALPNIEPSDFIRLAWEACQPLEMKHHYLVVD